MILYILIMLGHKWKSNRILDTAKTRIYLEICFFRKSSDFCFPLWWFENLLALYHVCLSAKVPDQRPEQPYSTFFPHWENPSGIMSVLWLFLCAIPDNYHFSIMYHFNLFSSPHSLFLKSHLNLLMSIKGGKFFHVSIFEYHLERTYTKLVYNLVF